MKLSPRMKNYLVKAMVIKARPANAMHPGHWESPSKTEKALIERGLLYEDYRLTRAGLKVAKEWQL